MALPLSDLRVFGAVVDGEHFHREPGACRQVTALQPHCRSENGTKNTLPLSRWLSLLVKTLRIYILTEGKQIARRRAEQKNLTPQTTANENRKQPQTLFFIALQLQCCRLVSMCMGRCISRFA